MKSFSASVSDWVRQTEARMEAVAKQSVQEVVKVAQTPTAKGGNLPVISGFLRNSIQASLHQPNLTVKFKPKGKQQYQYNASEVSLVIANAKLGDDIFVTYGANYAIYVHEGARGRPGRPWVALAAQRWQHIVNDVVARAQARAGQ